MARQFQCDEERGAYEDILAYVEGMRAVSAPIGPLYGAGWNGAVEAIAQWIRHELDESGTLE